MVSTYSDYDSDNQRQFPRQGIEYELCQEYNFPGLKGWSNEQVQWFKDNYIHIAGKIGLKRMEYSGAVTSAGISDFKYWYSLTPAERPLVGLTDEIACRINYLGLLLYSANSADANLGKTIEIIYWLQQQCYYEVEWVDSATNYPKEPTSPVSSAITIQGKDLPKVIHDRLSEDKKKDAAAGKKESIPQVFPKYPAV